MKKGNTIAKKVSRSTGESRGKTSSYDSRSRRGAVLPHEGKTRITMWIDSDTLNWFRARVNARVVGIRR